VNNSNPYEDEQANAQLIPSFTAFLDVLGFANRTPKACKEGHALTELEHLISAMKESGKLGLLQKSGQ
jgi:hypothetical protein